MKRPPVALLILLVALLALHWPAIFQAKIYGDEDVLGLFWADKCRLHRLFTGQEQWTYWDRLPFLGMPRLANFQMCWFSPESLYFGLLDPSISWRFFPLLSDLGLLCAVYYLIRGYASSSAAWLGAGFFVLTGDCLKTSQDIAVKFELACMAVMLACNYRWLASGRRRYLLGLALATGWQLDGGAVSQLYYQLLSLPFICLLQIWNSSPSTRLGRGLLAIGTFIGASLAFSLPWFPLLEWSAHGSRKVLEGGGFAEAYSLNLGELLSVFADEITVFGPARAIERGGGYTLTASFSLAVFGLVAYAARRKEWRLTLLLSLLLALQMMGEKGVLLWLLHKAVPFTQQIRGPHRFFYPAGLLWALLAAVGFDEIARRRPKLAWGLSLWAIGVNLWALQPVISGAYVPLEAFSGIPLPPPGAERVAVDFSKDPRPPLQWLAYPLTQGRATMIFPNVLSEGSYFRGLLFSQYGEKAWKVMPRLVYSFAPVPPAFPDHPLLRSWGLGWVLQAGPNGFGWRNLGPAPRHWTVVQVTTLADTAAETAWAQTSDWKPFEQASVAGQPVVVGVTPANITVLSDGQDEQLLRSSGPASLLISADNWDPGWECWVDGKQMEVRRANLALKACLIPEGNHTIQWRYRIHWQVKAAATGLTGVLLLIMVVGIDATRRK
ncbi:hypothetical protein JST97_00965 [bacterium]|nr:hypothetical protein [bacterium]